MSCSSTVVTIGNFDGVHRGHQALITACRQLASPQGQVVALAFRSHPMTELNPARAPHPLMSLAQREARLLEAGVDRVIHLDPTPDLLSLSPSEFLKRIVDEHHPIAIVEGPDFQFGRGRAGSVETLHECGKELGFQVKVVDDVEVVLTDHALVRASSTLLRWLIQHGRVRDAACVLGTYYELHSEIVEGKKRGREIGFPTANLATVPSILPTDGVYAGFAKREGTMWQAAISIGTNPTFEGNQRTCEAHLLDYNGPLDDYGWNIELAFHSWIREQIAFENVDSLIHQMKRDVQRCHQLLSTTSVTA